MRFGIDGAHDRQVRRLAGGAVEHEPVRPLGHPAAHEGAAPDFAAQIASALRFLVADADGLHGDAEVAREIAMRRHSRSGPQHVGDNVGDDAIGEQLVLGRALPARKGGPPDDRFGQRPKRLDSVAKLVRIMRRHEIELIQ